MLGLGRLNTMSAISIERRRAHRVAFGGRIDLPGVVLTTHARGPPQTPVLGERVGLMIDSENKILQVR